MAKRPMNAELTPPRLWDEQAMEAAVLDELLHTRAYPLEHFSGPALPAFYAILITGPAPSFYGRTSDPHGPPTLVYIGSCALARERAGRHRTNARRIAGLPISSLAMVAVPTASYPSALWGEATLIDRCSALWNEPFLAGWGSKSLGRHREGQFPSAFRRCHIGPGATKDQRRDAAQLQDRVTEYLRARPGPVGGWPWRVR